MFRSEKRKKYKEIFDSNAYFLIACDFNNEKKLYGYTNFRFDMDFDDEVLYWYAYNFRITINNVIHSI